MQKLLQQTKEMTPFRIMALLLGASLPCFYLGQALGILCVLLAFAMMLHPAIRAKIPATIKDLYQKPESKFLVIAVICLLPSVFLSIDVAQSVRVWVLAVMTLLLFACLTVFKHATLNDKLLVVKIFIISLLLWNSFIAYAYNFEKDWLYNLWSIRTQLGIVEKGRWFYVYSVPKLQLNGSFVLLPLLIYCVMIYLRQFFWRIIMLLTIISFIVLTITLSNRALLAGTIAILIVATLSVWLCRKEVIRIKIVTSLLTIFTLIIFVLFFFVPREHLPIFLTSSSEDESVVEAGNEASNEAEDEVKPKEADTPYVIGVHEEGVSQQSDHKPLLKPFLPYSVMRAPRQIFIYEGFQQWKKTPIFGIGLNVSDRHQKLQSNVSTYFIEVGVYNSISNVHNRFVEVLLEAGIVGFIGLIGFLIILTLRHLRHYITKCHQPALLLMLTHASYWATGMFQFSIWEAWIFIIFATSLIIIHALDSEKQTI